MAIREFNGTSDRIVTAGTGTPIAGDAYSIVAIVEPLVLDSSKVYVGLNNGGIMCSLAESGSGNMACFTSAASSDQNSTKYTEDVWNIAAVTKTAGNHPTRFHNKQLGAGSWSHTDGGDPLDNNLSNNVSIVFGASTSGGNNPKNCRIAAVGIYDFELTDGDIEAIDLIPTTQFLADLGAVALWEFNQASTGTAVNDLVGNADQTSISGTTVVTGNDPPGWTFGATVVPPLTFSLRLSGGSSNSDPATSIGGTLSSVSMPSTLFDNLDNDERILGLTDYRLIYVHNDDSAAGDVIAYITPQLEAGRQIAIGAPTQAAGVTVTAIANDTTNPSSVTFSAPSTVDTALSLGSIPAGSFRGLWLRRTVNAGTPVDPTNFATLRFKIDRSA